MTHIFYPYTVHQSDDGAWQVRFPDVPEALTEGATETEARYLAADALLAALDGLQKLGRDIPDPSPARGRVVVAVPRLRRQTQQTTNLKDTMEKTPFYLVWNSGGFPPSYKHPTRVCAEIEAERLARDNPGQHFYVLEPTHRFVKSEMVITEFDTGRPPF